MGTNIVQHEEKSKTENYPTQAFRITNPKGEKVSERPSYFSLQKK